MQHADYRTYIDIPGVKAIDLKNPSASRLSRLKQDHLLEKFSDQLATASMPLTSRILNALHWLEMVVDAEIPQLAADSAASARRVAGVRLHGKVHVAEMHGYGVNFGDAIGNDTAPKIKDVRQLGRLG